MKHQSSANVANVVAGIDHWLDFMRVEWPTPGYGGPVVHWWNHSLAFRGSGLDWRYEGIIDGYLALWRRTGDLIWMEKARRAGDDLVAGQLPSGNFRNSAFELNPATAGTPHEAAADIGLLMIAQTLSQDQGRPYLDAARRNLESFLLGQLWHDRTKTLRDGVGADSFVPNKAAAFVEAILLLSEVAESPDVVERYAIPTGDLICAMQVTDQGGDLDGAIAQNRFGDRIVTSYFPHYIARCLPALLRLAEITSETRFRNAVERAIAFLQRTRMSDGGYPHVLYPRGRRNVYPRWIAGAGDIVRAFDLARAAEIEADPQPTVDWIIRGARADGRIATAEGYERVVSFISRRDQFADEIGVAGWIDKSFRVLATRVDPAEMARAVNSVGTSGREWIQVPSGVLR